MSGLTDEDLLNSLLKSELWIKQWRKEIVGKRRYWEFQNPVRIFLRIHFHVAHNDPTPEEVEKTVHRIVSLYRSRNARKAAKTRARNKAKKSRSADREKQLKLL